MITVGPLSQGGRAVVVGAGLAGANACSQLRTQGFSGLITLLGAENARPYDRPPLTKAVLSGVRDETPLRVDLDALGVDLRLGVAATGLDPQRRVVSSDGGDFTYDGLIIATGAAAVSVPGPGRQHVVRTLQDALALRAELVAGRHVVLIGAGWIGAEVATAALAAGCRVTCVEAAPTVLHGALGAVGAEFVGWWSAVELRLESLVDRVEDGRVHLVGGEVIEADVVVTGVGARAAVGWLAGSGLSLDRGVITDEHLRAYDGVVAVGDAAVWRSVRYARHMRVEHWDNASQAPTVAVASLLSDGAPDSPVYDPVPYFWSDQFGHKVQYVGAHDESCRVVLRRPAEPLTGKPWWSAIWLDADDRVTAGLTVDRPREMVAVRGVIESGQPVSPALVADGDVPLSEAAASAGR